MRRWSTLSMSSFANNIPPKFISNCRDQIQLVIDGLLISFDWGYSQTGLIEVGGHGHLEGRGREGENGAHLCPGLP